MEFLSPAEVLEIHQDQLRRYGGAEGIRDIRLLLSAVAAPQATFDGRYLHADLHAKAAAYLFHIVRNHPFIDGNKRTGAVAALVFLHMNGAPVHAPVSALANLVEQVASGARAKDEIAAFLRKWSSDTIARG